MVGDLQPRLDAARVDGAMPRSDPTTMEQTLAAVPAVPTPWAVRPSDLLRELREALRLDGHLPPGDEELLVLCRAVAGYLRTSPLALDGLDEARRRAVAAFASAYPGWWQSDDAPYLLVAALLDDVFHQREVATPPAGVIDVLHRLAIGLLRRKAAPATHAAQLAMADWLASLYLVGSE